MNGSLLSIAIVAASAAVGLVVQRVFFPAEAPKRLGEWFEDKTGAAKRWAEKMRTAEIHGKAVR